MRLARPVLVFTLLTLLVALAVPGPAAIADAVVCTVVVYGTVFADQDGDNAQSLSEQGLSGIWVNLYKDSDGDGRLTPADPWVTYTLSDEQGNYLFATGPETGYHVAINLPPGYGPTDGLQRFVRTPGCEMYGVQAEAFGLKAHGLRPLLWLPLQRR
jgi:hypothetical protein